MFMPARLPHAPESSREESCIMAPRAGVRFAAHQSGHFCLTGSGSVDGKMLSARFAFVATATGWPGFLCST